MSTSGPRRWPIYSTPPRALEPSPLPKPPPLPLAELLRDAGPPSEEQMQGIRRAEARRALDNALHAQEAEREREQQKFRDHVARATSIGALMNIGA